MGSHLRQAWADLGLPSHNGRFRHVFLPPDPVEAYSAVLHLARRTAALNHHLASGQYDHDRLHDLVANEGFSHHPVHGTPPPTGYMASYDAPHGSGEAAVHHISEITPDHIATHRAAIAHHLEQPNSYQGGWHDTADGNVYLDASRHFHDEGECREHCVREQQKAYFKLDDFSERYVHPKLDPLAQKDHEAWRDRYSEVGHEPPAGYSTYAHRYPATEEQKQFWGDKGHHLAVRDKADTAMAGRPIGEFRAPRADPRR